MILWRQIYILYNELEYEELYKPLWTQISDDHDGAYAMLSKDIRKTEMRFIIRIYSVV